MLIQELLMDCPFCEKAKIKVRHKPSVTIKKRSVSATLGSRYNLKQSKEVYEVLEDCSNYGKTKEEIKKTDRKKTHGQGNCSEKNARDGAGPGESKIVSVSDFMNNGFYVEASMGGTENERFTMTWFYRAFACTDKIDEDSPNTGQRRIDLGDRFISLWICFNSIMRELYGEKLDDRSLINKSAIDDIWINLFMNSKSRLNSYLDELMGYDVKNMKTGDIERLKNKRFDELIEIIYRVRSNLFHGRKDPFDFKDSKDYKLIRLSFFILAELVMAYLMNKKLVILSNSEDYESVANQDIPEPSLSVEDFEDGFIFKF